MPSIDGRLSFQPMRAELGAAQGVGRIYKTCITGRIVYAQDFALGFHSRKYKDPSTLFEIKPSTLLKTYIKQ